MHAIRQACRMRIAPNLIHETTDPVIALVTEWTNQSGQVEKRHEHSDKGGTMRLGGQTCELLPGSLAHQIYGKDVIVERHRHRYEVNNILLPAN